MMAASVRGLALGFLAGCTNGLDNVRASRPSAWSRLCSLQSVFTRELLRDCAGAGADPANGLQFVERLRFCGDRGTRQSDSVLHDIFWAGGQGIHLRECR